MKCKNIKYKLTIRSSRSNEQGQVVRWPILGTRIECRDLHSRKASEEERVKDTVL